MRLKRLSLGLGLPAISRGAGREIPLVLPNYLNPAFTFTRASAASFFNDAGNLVEVGNNVPRLSSAGLLLEGQRTNGGNNPRGEGGVVGTSTQPTNWSVFAAGGLTTTFAARGVENGRNYVDRRISGTTTGTFYVSVFHNPAFAVTAGQPTTGSVWVSVVGGSLANIGTLIQQVRWSSGSITEATLTPTATPARFIATGIAPADATSAFHAFGLSFANGVAIDVTLRFSWPQAESGASFASSPILPPVGTPGASTRLADNVTATGAQFVALFPNGVGTVLVRATLPVLSPTGSTNQVLLSIGPDVANRIVAFNPAGSTNLSVGRSIGNSYVSAGTGAITAGAPFTFGLTSDGTTLSASINGGVLLTAAGVPPFQRLVIGADANLGTPMFGTINSLRALPRAVSDAELRALSLAA